MFECGLKNDQFCVIKSEKAVCKRFSKAKVPHAVTSVHSTRLITEEESLPLVYVLLALKS